MRTARACEVWQSVRRGRPASWLGLLHDRTHSQLLNGLTPTDDLSYQERVRGLLSYLRPRSALIYIDSKRISFPAGSTPRPTRGVQRKSRAPRVCFDLFIRYVIGK